MPKLRATYFLIGASLTMSMACEDVRSGPAATMSVIDGNAQTGTVNAELPLPIRVQVEDEAGRSVAGQVVTFVVTQGGGSVFAGTGTTDASGIVSEKWTLGTSTSTEQTLEARFTTGAGSVVTAVIDATATAGPVAKLIQPDGTWAFAYQGQSPDSLTVEAEDSFGNPAGGARVDWTLVTSAVTGTTVTPAASTATSAGVAQTRITLGRVVTAEPVAWETVRATSGAATPVEFSVQVNPVFASRIALDGTSLIFGHDQLFDLPSSDLSASPLYGPYPDQAFQVGPRFDVDDRATEFGQMVISNGRLYFTWKYPSVSSIVHSVAAGGSAINYDLGTLAQGRCVARPDLETDGTYLFVSCRDQLSNSLPRLLRVRISDGALSILVNNIEAVAYTVHDGFVYFIEAAGGSVKRVPTAGGDAVSIVTGVGIPGEYSTRWGRLAIADSRLFWVENGGGSTHGWVCHAPLSGGSVTACIGGFTPTAQNLQADGSHLYVNDEGTLKRVSLSNSSVATVASGHAIFDYVLDGAHIVYAGLADGRLIIRRIAK